MMRNMPGNVMIFKRAILQVWRVAPVRTSVRVSRTFRNICSENVAQYFNTVMRGIFCPTCTVLHQSNAIGVLLGHHIHFYFPDRENIVIVKKKQTNKKPMLRFLWIFTFWGPRSPKKWFWKNVVCTLYSVTVAGDVSTSGIKMKLWIWDKTRTEMRFFGVWC